MIVLLLSSVFGLSDVSMMDNNLPVVTVSTVDFDTSSLTLTAAITSNPAGTDISTHTFSVAIFKEAKSGNILFTKSFDATKLTATESQVDVSLVMDVTLLDLDKIFLDIIAKPNDGASSEVSLLETRKEVRFAAKKESVVVTHDETNYSFEFQLTATLASPIDDTKFAFGDITCDVFEAGTPNKYTVIIPSAALHSALSTHGYFKGVGLAQSTLPISLFDLTPGVKLQHVDSENLKATMTGLASGNKVYLKVGSKDPVLLTEADGKYALKYVDLAEARIFYTSSDGTLISNKQDISLPAFVPPTLAWQPDEYYNKPPKLKFTFANELPNRRLILVDEQTNRTVNLHEKVSLVPLAELVGTAAYHIVLDNENVPHSHPRVFEKATLQQTEGEPSSQYACVEIVFGEGYFTEVPRGLLAHVVGESDNKRARYGIFYWNGDEGNRAKGYVERWFFEDMIHEDVESYICPDYSGGIPPLAEAKRLSTALIAIPKVPSSTRVTVGTVTFKPEGSCLNIPIKSDDDATASSSTIELVIYSWKKPLEEIVTRVNVKALLDKSDKIATVPIDIGMIPANRKTLYVDVLEAHVSEKEFSIIKPVGLVGVDFNKKDELIKIAKDGADIKVMFTLETALPASLEGITLEFLGQHLPIHKETTPEKTYSAKVSPDAIKQATSRNGYVKGTSLATTTLPFTVLAPIPKTEHKYHNSTHVEYRVFSSELDPNLAIISGNGAPKLVKQCEEESFLVIEHNDLKEDCLIYYCMETDVPVSAQVKINKLVPFDPPVQERWVVPSDLDDDDDDEDWQPSLNITFANSLDGRYLVLIHSSTARSGIHLFTKEQEAIHYDLVCVDAFYTTGEKFGQSTGLPIPFPRATFKQTKGNEVDKKVPVTIEMSVGFLLEEATGILVHAEGQTDYSTAKFYKLLWKKESPNQATAMVNVDDWKEITNKDIESYVVGDFDEDKPNNTVKLSEKFVLFPKKKEPEPEGPGTDEPGNKSKGAMTTAAVIGIVCGIVLFVVLTVIIVYVLYHRMKRNSGFRKTQDDPLMGQESLTAQAALGKY